MSTPPVNNPQQQTPELDLLAEFIDDQVRKEARTTDLNSKHDAVAEPATVVQETSTNSAVESVPVADSSIVVAAAAAVAATENSAATAATPEVLPPAPALPPAVLSPPPPAAVAVAAALPPDGKDGDTTDVKPATLKDAETPKAIQDMVVTMETVAAEAVAIVDTAAAAAVASQTVDSEPSLSPEAGAVATAAAAAAAVKEISPKAAAPVAYPNIPPRKPVLPRLEALKDPNKLYQLYKENCTQVDRLNSQVTEKDRSIIDLNKKLSYWKKRVLELEMIKSPYKGKGKLTVESEPEPMDTAMSSVHADIQTDPEPIVTMGEAGLAAAPIAEQEQIEQDMKTESTESEDGKKLDSSLSVKLTGDFGRFGGKWKDSFNKLVEYKLQHGNCEVPKSHKPQSLHWWVRQQRYNYKNLLSGKGDTCDMNQDRIDALNSIGFTWWMGRKTKDGQWEANFQKLLQFKSLSGTFRVTKEYDKKLHRWVEHQRARKKLLEKNGEGKCKGMTWARVEKLNSIGFTWSARDDPK